MQCSAAIDNSRVANASRAKGPLARAASFCCSRPLPSFPYASSFIVNDNNNNDDDGNRGRHKRGGDLPRSRSKERGHRAKRIHYDAGYLSGGWGFRLYLDDRLTGKSIDDKNVIYDAPSAATQWIITNTCTRVRVRECTNSETDSARQIEGRQGGWHKYDCDIVEKNDQTTFFRVEICTGILWLR